SDELPARNGQFACRLRRWSWLVHGKSDLSNENAPAGRRIGSSWSWGQDMKIAEVRLPRCLVLDARKSTSISGMHKTEIRRRL
ncbi:hypothetical protein, partial [Mesorhizobium sp. M7A.F.Ca.CA.001.05.1.1]|uniref:hypothetical protein n=1 Tax=Mesorhizobium sp. M7A.F.Ca.CA.001.05.1.1 TaxID=2496721 RepID=UPI0019D275FA